MSGAYLEVKNLKKYFSIAAGMLHAVDGVSFSLERGKTIGIVGESGCGKSTMGRVIARLTDATDGEVLLNGQNILNMRGKQLKQLRNEVQMIFQDPFSSLNPRKSVYSTIEEPLLIQKKYPDKAQLQEKVYSLMDSVGIARRLANSYPHELDGGRRQRIGIARALALEPSLIVCDEPAQRARRLHTGADTEHAQASAAGERIHICVHHARSERRAPLLPGSPGHVYGPDGGEGPRAGAFREPAASLYQGAT